ncbi:Sugar phosphate permease [Methylobacterium sp. 174MFSha1.1]|uniref:MFS transporter n=1 Tax=Methylobacterium sp. 174MFSha1.1 TaxID=1502749 RepID=UPI0008E5D0DA|nr:MFS transporter [Methylobacterium sp. 174MFSha1.1]SFV16790.1 Sugar phosphate permease [Methylobacterium sp. 174MFSha1.1]
MPGALLEQERRRSIPGASTGQTVDGIVKPVFRWTVLLISWLAVTLTFTDRLAWASVAVEAGRTLGLPVAALGVFVTAFYSGYVISNAVGGLSSDRFGSERVMLCSLVPLGLATFGFGFTTSITYGLLMQAIMGLAAGANHAATVKLIVSWFGLTERGRAMGLLTSANSFGVVLANAIVPSLSVSIGWGGAYNVLGLITSVFGLAAFLILRHRPAPQAPAPSPRFDPMLVFRNRDLTLLGLAGFCAMWGTWGVAFWANALMTRQFGMTPVQAGGLLALFGVAGMVSKPALGFLLDLIGSNKKKPILICVFTTFAAALIIYSGLDSIGEFTIATPLLGLVAFIYTPVLVASVSEVAGPQQTGTAVGITNAIWQLGSVIVPIAIGVVFSATGSFQVAFLALAAGPLLAALLMLPVRYKAAV